MATGDYQHADGVYEFGDFRLHAAQRRLTARTDGRPIELTQKAFDALCYLVQHPGQLLDKSMLIAAVWPNVVVEENNLNQVISTLRRALGDGSGDRRFIVTVPGRGYQFVAAVREVHEETPPAPLAAPLAQAVTSARRSIAVLPFASLSSDPEKDYFGDGIAEELIYLLARAPGLKVPARTSSFAYKGRNIDVRQIARELGVEMLLEGSVRTSGDRIRVTAQLIEAESGFHLWSQTYDRRFAEVFQLQDELSGAIVQALRINLGDRTAASLRAAPPTKSLEAYRLYLQARALYYATRVERATELLEECVALDPSFARAHAELAWMRYASFNIGIRGPDVLVEARQSAERALALDPDAANAHAVVGAEHVTRGEWARGEASLRRAIDLEPREVDFRLWLALLVLGPGGKLREALAEVRYNYELAPGLWVTNANVGGFGFLAGENQDAERYLRAAVEMGAQVDSLPLPVLLSEVARRAGKFALAAQYLQPALPTAVVRSGGMRWLS